MAVWGTGGGEEQAAAAVAAGDGGRLSEQGTDQSSTPPHTSIRPRSPDPAPLTPPYSRRLSNPKHPWLLRALLGSKVSVVCLRKDQAIGIREEYHAFRSRAVPVMFAIPLMLFVGMRRADAVAAGAGGDGAGHVTLTPPLMTGAWGRGGGAVLLVGAGLFGCSWCGAAWLRLVGSYRVGLLRHLRGHQPTNQPTRIPPPRAPPRHAALPGLDGLLLPHDGPEGVRPAGQRQPDPAVVGAAPLLVGGVLARHAGAAGQQPE